jgi:hypothetical protein
MTLKPLRKRFKPNPLVNAPALDVEMAGDIHYRPALAEKFMYMGKQSLQPFQPVSAVEGRPVCSVLPHCYRANRPLALTAQMLLNPVAQVLDQMKATCLAWGAPTLAPST